MRITTASPADIPALADLLTILFTQEVEFIPDRAAQMRGLNRIIDNPEFGCILVARDQDAIVGMVNLLYTISTALGERVAILEDMVVLPSARGSGIGTQLLQAAIAYARTVGCKRITLLTDQSNEIAQQFYAKQGFTVSSMVPMRLAL
jgi:GNAT superfamily N-acetyltransferase